MSYRLKISPKDRATGRFKSRVNRRLLNAILSAKQKHGLTQSQIAELMEVDKSTVSKILNGKGNLTLKTIGDISWAVGLIPNIEFKEKEAGVLNRLSNSGKKLSHEATRNTNSGVNVFQYTKPEDQTVKTSSRSREVKLAAQS